MDCPIYQPCKTLIGPFQKATVLGCERSPQTRRDQFKKETSLESSLKQWVMCLMALCVLVPGTNEASPLKISLQSDQGTYFSRCNNCQKGANGDFSDTVTTHATTSAEPFSQFQLVLVGNARSPSRRTMVSSWAAETTAWWVAARQIP